VRVRTLDDANKIYTVAGSDPAYGTGPATYGPTGQLLAAAKFPVVSTPVRNPYDGSIYLLEPNFVRRIDTAAGTIARLTGSGVQGLPVNGDSLAGAKMLQMSGVGFLSASSFLLWPYNNGTASFIYGGASYSVVNGATYEMQDWTSLAVSPCDGHLLSECHRWGNNVSPVDSDGAGNLYFLNGQMTGGPNASAPSFRLFKIAAGTQVVTQLMGNFSYGYSPDCATPGCAKMLSFSAGPAGRYDAPYLAQWDPVGNRVLVVDFDGTNFVVRSVDSQDQLTTLGTLANSAWLGVYDRAKYFYYYRASTSRFARLDVTTGVVSDLPANPFPTGFGGFSVVPSFTLGDGGNFVAMQNGVLYRYVGP
jgi:hypothetical protein